ncbi:MAG: hypothetical protein ACOVK2_06370, partial [Candidatus Fonsibacter sp.]
KQFNETINECYISVGPVTTTTITTSELFYYGGSTYFLSSGTAEQSASVNGKGFYMVNRNVNNLSLFKNTTKYSRTDNYTTQYNNIYINGTYIIGNPLTTQYTMNNTLSFSHIGNNLTDSEEVVFYNLVQTLQTTLGRNV